MNIAVLVSGSGSNLQAIIDAMNGGFFEDNDINIKVVIADRPCYGLERAETANIATYLFKRNKNLSQKIDKVCIQKEIDLIVLAGFLSILNESFCEKWDKKIINLHPSLLPQYGGVGMYGERVHKAVLDNIETKSGATVHYVTAGVDEGEIILQDAFDIPADADLAWLKQKINEIEKPLLLKAIKKIASENKS